MFTKILISIGFIFSALSPSLARADYHQILCTNTPDSHKKDQDKYELLLEINTKQDYLWPDRVTLAEVKGDDRDRKFVATDIYKDLFFVAHADSERRYLAKNYTDEAFENKMLGFSFDTSGIKIEGEDTFNLTLDFYGRFNPIFEGMAMHCHKL